MKIVFPAQSVTVDTVNGVDPVWYEKLKQVETILNNGTLGQGVLPTNATTGHAYMPTSAGAPTGIPTVRSGYAAFVFDTTNNKLWIYNGAWKGVVVA